MCGIAGHWGIRQPGLIGAMCEAIAHRGPDGEGIAEFPEFGAAIGMRRLAIIDIEGGIQPFVSPDGRVHLVFNGEIYNFQDLRAELTALGHRFVSRSDTEVLLAAYLQWGEAGFARLAGMFAVAIVDRRGPSPFLLLARDRMGQKPLYYAQAKGGLAFASEIKALRAWDACPRGVDIGALRAYLALRYVPGPTSLFAGVRKLPAAHVMRVDGAGVSIRPWRSTALGKVTIRDAREAREATRAAVDLAVGRHMIADVPVGAFLSGGVDSSLVVAHMARHASGPVRTFSIGFPDFPRDERAAAAATARALGTEHVEFECRAADMASLPDIVAALDEPIGDPIVVPTYVLAREARKAVKVVLVGEGGDEVFGGYVFHRKIAQLRRLRAILPPAAFALLSRAVGVLPPALLSRALDYPGTLGTEGRRKIAMTLAHAGTDEIEGLYRDAISLFDPADASAAAAGPLAGAVLDPALRAPGDGADPSVLRRLAAAQYRDWLPDLILPKLDKLTMAHSIEGRVPLLDDAVVDVGASIADDLKLAPDADKKVLREVAADSLPAAARAPKRPFHIPLESYAAAPPLADIMKRTLDAERTRRRGLFDPAWIAAQRAAGDAGGFLPLKRLFAIAALELWFERFEPDAAW